MSSHSKKNVKSIIVTSLLLLAGIAALLFGLQSQKEIEFFAEENNAINYKVYLKENDFFDEPFLGEGGIYITSLIDHIDVDFHYNEKLSEYSNGNTEYIVRAIISADAAEDEDMAYWSKEYEILEPQVVYFDNEDNVAFDVSTSIDYQKYNDMLDKFRQEYPVASGGKLKVELAIKNNIDADKFNNSLESESKMALSLPLLKRAVNAKIDTNIGEKEHVFKTVVSQNSIVYSCLFFVGIVLIITSIVIVLVLAVKHYEWKREHLYLTTLNKILNTYDSIITNTLSLPSFAGLRKIEVSSFEEILDAYNELHLPVNYYSFKSKKKSLFFILANDSVWFYNLRSEDAKKREK